MKLGLSSSSRTNYSSSSPCTTAADISACPEEQIKSTGMELPWKDKQPLSAVYGEANTVRILDAEHKVRIFLAFLCVQSIREFFELYLKTPHHIFRDQLLTEELTDREKLWHLSGPCVRLPPSAPKLPPSLVHGVHRLRVACAFRSVAIAVSHNCCCCCCCYGHSDNATSPMRYSTSSVGLIIACISRYIESDSSRSVCHTSEFT